MSKRWTAAELVSLAQELFKEETDELGFFIIATETGCGLLSAVPLEGTLPDGIAAEDLYPVGYFAVAHPPDSPRTFRAVFARARPGTKLPSKTHGIAATEAVKRLAEGTKPDGETLVRVQMNAPYTIAAVVVSEDAEGRRQIELHHHPMLTLGHAIDILKHHLPTDAENALDDAAEEDEHRDRN